MTKTLRYAAAALLAAALTCTTTGCGRQQGSEGDPKPQIALIMKSLANEFFSTMADGAKAHQVEHSEAYDLVVNGIKDERDLSRQVALVEEMIARKVDAIVIAPADSKALVNVCKRAVDAGIVVVNIDNKMDAEVLAEAGVTIPFVGPDNRAGAAKVGRYLAENLPSGTPVGILEGIRTAYNAQQRRLGFEDAMREAGLPIADAQSANWEMNIANQVASAMLSEHPEIRALLCANDSMALGAIAAVRAAGRAGEVVVVGFDNISAAREALQAGALLATADQYADRLAVYGIEFALRILEGQAAPADKETPVDLVTAETLAAETQP